MATGSTPPLIGKGLENLKKAYGSLATSTSAPSPSPSTTTRRRPSRCRVDIDEGKQFYVSRIEFQGNTITRDRVIRRELLLDEGQVYNSQLWEYSLLRLNQLEYFDPLKVDQDSEAHQNRGSRHRRPAPEGQGEGQELHRPQRRRQRPVRRLPRRQLPDQQLPRPGRNPQRAGQHRQREPPVPVRLLPALRPQPPAQCRLPDLQQQVRLQRRQVLPDHNAAQLSTCPPRSSRSRRTTTRLPPA